MRKFKFTLQTLLNVKVALEKRYMGELADCEARIARFYKELEQLNHTIEAQKYKYINEMLNGGLHASDLETWSVGFRVMRERIQKQHKKIQAAEDERRLIQKRLVEVMRERKTLEKLRENQYEEYKIELKAEDAKMLDDFVSNRIKQKGMSIHG